MNSLLHIIISLEYDKHIIKRKMTNNTNIYDIKSTLLTFLVLDCNVDVNNTNVHDITPLYVALGDKNNEDLVELIVQRLGGHVDQSLNIHLPFCLVHESNYKTSCYEIVMNNEAAIQLCYCYREEVSDFFSDNIRQLFNNSVNLKCLAAKVIKKQKHRYNYKNRLHSSVEYFINLH